HWAKLSLDFEPGSETRYSNTDYVIAGRIVEKAAQEPLMQFLEEHFFNPLGMSAVTEDDSHALLPPDAAGYTQYGLGPVRLAPQEGLGWKFSSAELAMRPRDLALWDIGLMNHTLLQPQSYQAETEPVKLTDGKDSDYALGLQTSKRDGQRSLYFQAEISGFLSENYIFPDDKVAIIVLTNSDAGSPPPSLEMARRLIYLFVPPTGMDKTVRDLLGQIQRGDIDRSVLSQNANAFLTDTVVADMSLSLAALGPVRALRQITEERQQGGMSFRYYWVEFGARMLVVSVGIRPDGRIEQFLLWDIAVPMY
ncbi:MAG: beta-lactamase family protein, partial [Deltaproteobacteria bacterium]|nr:beta-lactamase family protein [Deltaproteobacteria bacterium]